MGGGNSTKGESQYTFGIKYPKTGGFIGGEFGVGGGMASIPWRLSGYNYGGSNHDYVVIPINIFGGYQWYFYDQPYYTFGVRVRGHIGYTNYNATLGYAPDITLTSHGIQYGAEAQIVWDILDYETHTAGIHFAPIGFEGSTFFGKATVNSYTPLKLDLGSHTKFAFTISFGFHYYYGLNHQVYATYKYRTYSNTANATEKYYSVANNVFMLGYAYKF